MNKSINILDQDYSLWLQDLSKRYRRSQVKASIKVNGKNAQQLVEQNSKNEFGQQVAD